jgi:hypothetical protein
VSVNELLHEIGPCALPNGRSVARGSPRRLNTRVAVPFYQLVPVAVMSGFDTLEHDTSTTVAESWRKLLLL